MKNEMDERVCIGSGTMVSVLLLHFDFSLFLSRAIAAGR